NAATVALDHVLTSESILRSVRPEAVLEIDGRRFEVGGLTGQPVHNFILHEWLNEMKATNDAFRFKKFEAGRTKARFDWKQRKEWLSTKAACPPAGVSLSLSFEKRAAAPGVVVNVHYE